MYFTLYQLKMKLKALSVFHLSRAKIEVDFIGVVKMEKKKKL